MVANSLLIQVKAVVIFSYFLLLRYWLHLTLLMVHVHLYPRYNNGAQGIHSSLLVLVHHCCVFYNLLDVYPVLCGRQEF